MTLVAKIVDTDVENPKGPPIAVHEGLKNAIRDQLIAVIGGEDFTSQHLRRLAHLCTSMANAMSALERPEKLLRQRFGGYMGDEYGEDSGAIAPSPNIETYGANAQRELMAAIGQLGKALAPKPPQPSVTELVTAIGLASVRKDKAVEKALRKKLDKMMTEDDAESAAVAALPPPEPPRGKGGKKIAATVVAQGGA